MYPTGKKKAFDNDYDLVADASTKNLLVKSTYTRVVTHEFVDNTVANDIIDEECDMTGYTGGFAGAGRLVPASRTAVVAGEIVEFAFTSPVWTSVGNGTNNLVGGVVLCVEDTGDTTSPVFCFDELVGNVNTNGGDLTYDPSDTTDGTQFDW